MSRIGASKARARRAAQTVALAAPVSAQPQITRQAPPPDMRRWTTDAVSGELKFAQISSILQQAERGDTVQYADLTRRMLDSDDHLCSVYETRVSLVAGARWKLNPGEGDTGLAQQAAEDCRRLLESLGNVERLFADILDADWTGWAALELDWQPRGDLVWLNGYEWLHPRRFRFNDSYQIYLYDDGMAKRSEGAPTGTYGALLAPDKYVIHQPRVLPNYNVASGLARAAVRYWWIKIWASKFALGGAEVGGNPRAWAIAPTEASQDVVDDLYEGLSTLSADGIGVFKAGTTVEIQAPLAQGASSVWDFLLKRCDAGFSKILLGSTLNVEIGDTGGAYSAAESQGDVTIMPRARRSSRAMWSTIERDVFRPFLTWNRHRYGGVVPPIPRGESILVEDTPSAETISTVITAGGRVRHDELRSSAGLEPLGAENGGDEFVSAPQGGAGAGFPFAQTPTASPSASQAASPSLTRRQTTSRPWLTAASLAGSDATVTSGHSRTT